MLEEQPKSSAEITIGFGKSSEQEQSDGMRQKENELARTRRIGEFKQAGMKVELVSCLLGKFSEAHQMFSRRACFLTG